MIRSETAADWLLVTHPDHAALAGRIADAWGNSRFARPEPWPAVRYAVYHHDDGWFARDATPSLTRGGKPEAFTRELVGAYSAFEEIDLPSYLAVRGAATTAVANVDPVAAVVVSMHTVNLLTEQANLATIRTEHRGSHADFVLSQQDWQRATAREHGLDEGAAQRGFEFLQCCDSLSLIICAGYDEPRPLRHWHPDRDGVRHSLISRPAGPDAWTIDPWPFAADRLDLFVPRRRVAKSAATDQTEFRAAFAAAPVEMLAVVLRPV